MKKIIFSIMLITSAMTLTSFGIIDNPKVAAHYQKNVSKLSSDTNKQAIFKNKIADSQFFTKDDNKDQVESKSLLRSVFGFIYTVVSEFVFALISK